MRALREAVHALLFDPAEGHLDRTLARSILGTDEVETIASRVEAYVREAFDEVAPRGCLFFTQSVGAVWGLELDGGERIVLKAHAVGGAGLRAFASFEELSAAYTAHALMAERGVACARVLRAPRPWEGGAVAAMSFLDARTGDDPHDPAVRRAMAEELARIAAIGRSIDGDASLVHLPRIELPRGALYPAPHNALFDLHVPGGEWIDARARPARLALEASRSPPVVFHTDASAANVEVRGGRVVAVFDMDSIARESEMRGLASTAVHFSYRGDPPWTWPTRDEAIAFVDDYVRARGRPLDRDERCALDAAAILAMTYTARCEHGLHPDEEGAMRARLRASPDAYFE